MDITISSIMSTGILISVMALLVCPILRNSAVISRAGPGCMILILMSLVIRMLFPVELWFAYNIRIEHILPSVRKVLNYEMIQSPYVIMIWDVFMCLWVAGIVCRLGKKLLFCIRLKRLLSLLPSAELGSFLAEHGFDLPEDEKAADIRIVTVDLVKSPCLIRIKKGFILLPKYEYSPMELYYIIRHELMHDKHKDVYKKVAVDLLCILFWWNPVFIYLKNTMFHLIEISNDGLLTRNMSEGEKESYMNCLLHAATVMEGKEIPFGASFKNAFLQELKQRLVLIKKGTEGQKGFRRGLVILTMVMMILSFSVILEPYGRPLEGIPMEPENTYLIQNGEMYDVYVEGEYFFSTSDLVPFPGVKIYKNKEEYKNE